MDKNTRNAELMEKIKPETTARTWEISVASGQQAIDIPPLCRSIDRIYLIGARNRPLYLTRLTKETYEDFGRKFKVGDPEKDEGYVHIRGVPVYYSQGHHRIYLWPVPAHTWNGVIEGQT